MIYIIADIYCFIILYIVILLNYLHNVDFRKASFPDASTPYQFFDGIQYDQLHVINIKSSPNNTIMSLTDFKGNY